MSILIVLTFFEKVAQRKLQFVLTLNSATYPPCDILKKAFLFHITGSAVLVAETMLDGQTPYSCLQSLNMLVQTEGRERTQQHYSDLLSANGFGAVRVTHTGSFLDVIIALKK